MKVLKLLYIENRFYYIASAVVVLFLLSFIIEWLFFIAKISLFTFGAFFLIDILLVFLLKKGVLTKRITPDKFSNGDINFISLQIENHYDFSIYLKIIDELPEQFQIRDFKITKQLNPSEEITLKYEVRPTERGEYHFGKLNVYASSFMGLVSKRYIFSDEVMVPTYPAFLQLKKYDLLAISNQLHLYGIKKIRKIGHTMEFEQIKEYVQGDDLRTINWKATAKKNQLMVNQFQDERSQPVYSIIDKGRVMKMPFNGLSLLDYAINASLIISNVILKKQDKAGVFTFSKKVENAVVADRRNNQMQRILETLYRVETDFWESDYGRLYADIKKHINQRSLLFLYTNFETLDALHRQLPYLKGIAKNHLLVVVFFKNTELDTLIKTNSNNVEEIYDKVIAEKFAFEKRLIVNELKKYGIYSILTAPEDLTIDTINKYLEIKARGLI
ncbi:DUF58 domain-containing protein [Galbibacter mesophilus]|uniref:DUF58 domain-containing protein n=1 Tax=Galbibacter mesophilus TaxID=379069 RepID=UPI00191D151B|nr:DUF58 domain-containing protein [Galbibacter mesophilus]MCM5664296.1 DUF58 domain-containing protein [Galbibacter mesophilus]